MELLRTYTYSYARTINNCNVTSALSCVPVRSAEAILVYGIHVGLYSFLIVKYEYRSPQVIPYR